jgi:hypothetical protein
MNPSELKILSLYKKDPNVVFSTSEIIKAVEIEEYEEFEKVLSDKLSSKEALKKAKRKKAKLHRKILYYLNKLVDEKVLKIVKEGSKGEKYFAISLEEGEELVVEKYKKREITISKPRTPAMPTEGYEQSGIVIKVEEPTWIDRLNCIILEGKAISNTDRLFTIINNCFSIVNDSIGVNNFEIFVNTAKSEELIKKLLKLDDDCRDFGKKISLIADTSNSNDEKLSEFLSYFADTKPVNISIILEIDPMTLHEKYIFFEAIAKSISTKGASVYIKNKSAASSPYCVGNGGIYCFSENEWGNYAKNVKGKVLCVSCAQSSLIVDVKKFYSSYGFSAEIFEKFVINCAESLLSANSIQRRKSAEFFEYLVELNSPFSSQTFMFSRNYLRFFDFKFLEQKFGEGFSADLFKRIKQKVDDFTFSEETIYKSCGMPTSFRIAVASAADSNLISPPEKEMLEFSHNEDIHDKNVSEKLRQFESSVDTLNGLVSFVRHGNTNPDAIVREWSLLISSYKIPLFVYNFRRIEGVDLKLNEFIGGKE